MLDFEYVGRKILRHIELMSNDPKTFNEWLYKYGQLIQKNKPEPC